MAMAMDSKHIRTFKASLARIEFLVAIQSHRNLYPEEQIEEELLRDLAPIRDALNQDGSQHQQGEANGT